MDVYTDVFRWYLAPGRLRNTKKLPNHRVNKHTDLLIPLLSTSMEYSRRNKSLDQEVFVPGYLYFGENIVQHEILVPGPPLKVPNSLNYNWWKMFSLEQALTGWRGFHNPYQLRGMPLTRTAGLIRVFCDTMVHSRTNVYGAHYTASQSMPHSNRSILSVRGLHNLESCFRGDPVHL